jgi:hypothetical protein
LSGNVRGYFGTVRLNLLSFRTDIVLFNRSRGRNLQPGLVSLLSHPKHQSLTAITTPAPTQTSRPNPRPRATWCRGVISGRPANGSRRATPDAPVASFRVDLNFGGFEFKKCFLGGDEETGDLTLPLFFAHFILFFHDFYDHFTYDFIEAKRFSAKRENRRQEKGQRRR